VSKNGSWHSFSFAILLGFTAIPVSATAQSTAPNQWAWMNGSSTDLGQGVYGTLGSPAPGNTPGSRTGAAAWTDSKGHLWLFGGEEGIAGSGVGELNDLWEFDPATNQWAWISGSKTTSAIGIYTAPGAVPGSRDSAFSWVDSSGNLWLFGGLGFDESGRYGYLGDLWKFNPSTAVWTYVSGSEDLCATSGDYGTEGKPSPMNNPGCRSSGVSWIDQSGNLWLFGGQIGEGFLTSYLNDLWEYNKTSGEWAWMNGSNNSGPFGNGPMGVYGTLGVPNAANTPGARIEATAWTDKSGRFWLFGGVGNGSVAFNSGYLNDLWEYNPSTNEWAWMSGSNLIGSNGVVPGVYGTLGVLTAGNVPPSRASASSWVDGEGNFWVFGGNGDLLGYLNDLWVFNPKTNEWGWMNGSNGSAELFRGDYGVLGSPAEGNVPGQRESASSWTDAKGNLWLFGGSGADSTGSFNQLNDLWELEPSTSATYESVPAPTFSPAPGNYSAGLPITLSDAVSGATIYYTTDGTTPTTSPTLFYPPNYQFWVGGSPTTVRAIAVDINYFPSAEADATYNITLGDKATIAVTPASSSVSQSAALSVAIAVSGASGNPTPTGTVTITSGSYASAATALLNGNATVSIPANSLALGSDTLTANYSGDGYYDSGSGTAALAVTTPPSFTLSGPAVTIAPGATTGNSSTITVTPEGGFTGNVALTAAVTSSPSGAQYAPTLSFGTTTPVVVNGVAAATATLTISTTAATTSAAVIPRRPGNPWYAAGSAALAFLLFFGSLRKRSGWRTLTGMLVLLAMLTGGVLACGSGGSNSGGGGGGGGSGIAGTTAGSYTVTVTGTAGAITSSGTVTLTVQ